MTNIRNSDGYLLSFWDWSVYNGCFGSTKIRITDVDGLVERHGQFLLIETKKPGETIPFGQRILFDQLTKQPNWHVLILYGEVDQPIAYQLWKYQRDRRPATTQTVKELIARWFTYADKHAE